MLKSLLAAAALAGAAQASTMPLSVQVDQTSGAYTINVGGVNWFSSNMYAIRSNGASVLLRSSAFADDLMRHAELPPAPPQRCVSGSGADTASPVLTLCYTLDTPLIHMLMLCVAVQASC